MTADVSNQIDGWYVLLEATSPTPSMQLWFVAISDQTSAEAKAVGAPGALVDATVTSSKANHLVLAHYKIQAGGAQQYF
ncbi:MAG: hypothetical protein ABL908_10865 [Hyphomicrobium sp.]